MHMGDQLDELANEKPNTLIQDSIDDEEWEDFVGEEDRESDIEQAPTINRNNHF